MTPLPLRVRLLVLAMAVIALLPLAWFLAELDGVVPSGLLGAAVAVSILLCLACLVAFEPPRRLSVRAWLEQLQCRINTARPASPTPPPKEQ